MVAGGIRIAKQSQPTAPDAGYLELWPHQDWTPSRWASQDETGAITTPEGWTRVQKAADESVSSSAVVQNDDELLFVAAAGKNYDVELDIVYDSAAGAGTPDLKCDLGEDATARGVFHGIGFSTADAAQDVQALANQTATMTFGTAATKRVARIRGSYTGNGGTFRFRWAQNTSGANATTVRAGSELRYRLIV